MAITAAVRRVARGHAGGLEPSLGEHTGHGVCQNKSLHELLGSRPLRRQWPSALAGPSR